MAVLGIMHWKQHYRDKLVGSEAVWQVVRNIHKIERGEAENDWILRRVRSQDAPLNWFRRFHTHKLGQNDPVLAKLDSTQWEPAAKETEEQEIDRFLQHMADEELTAFIEAQGELVRELERRLLPPPTPKQRKGATKH